VAGPDQPLPLPAAIFCFCGLLVGIWIVLYAIWDTIRYRIETRRTWEELLQGFSPAELRQILGPPKEGD
jgi:hypothetical protein